MISKATIHVMAVAGAFVGLLCSCERPDGDAGADRLAQVTDTVWERYTRVSDATEPTERQVDTLLALYTRRYLVNNNGSAIEPVEAFLLEHAAPASLGYAFIHLVHAASDSPFALELRERMTAETEVDEVAFRYAALLHDVQLIRERERSGAIDWEQVVVLMSEARALRPTYLHNDFLARAYNELGMRREVFELAAYRYLDEGEESDVNRRRLRRLYRAIDAPTVGLDEELNRVATRLNQDIVRWSPTFPEYRFQREVFTDVQNRGPVVIDFGSHTSPVFGAPMALVVFTTECPYCRDHLHVMSQLSAELADSVFVVAVLRPDETSMDERIDRAGWYRSQNALQIPLFVPLDSSPLFATLQLPRVPLLLFFDTEGNLTASFQPHNTANLADKIRRFIRDNVDSLAGRDLSTPDGDVDLNAYRVTTYSNRLR